ncbi:ER lumen protein-retaining receptor C28H8.4 like [Actinidia chinensis var. chinensis]|uniref:ER lumen protein-retaining receptor C28H8.4 like n=1 Tax=Actinidia chinensis var. chinensis TaxID=1590841 RepID=A0A2R6QJR0_ACTCC|nr:ER lumen protein-retaining receptor C28H8.4 like [Actinidia chinensis var. chinensis]
MGRRRSSPVNKLFGWVRRQSMKVKAFLAITTVLCSLAALRLVVKDHNHFFVASEATHVAGTVVLIYKLATQKTCFGLSLKTQELTAIFLAVRTYCSFAMEGNIHTVLDFATLVFTLWVIYMIRFKLKSTYTPELDNLVIYYMVIPCAVLSILIHPNTNHAYVSRILWAFCVYLESVSVLPQLRLIQNAKMVEPFTAHYVFALGVARFLGCAHWMIQVYDTSGKYLFLVGTGHIWLPTALLAEIVQTFVLADFCYYYVKSVMNGQLLVNLVPV